MKTKRSILVSLLGSLLLLAFMFYQYNIDCNYRLSADDFSGVDYAKEGIPGLGYAWKSYWGWEGTFLNKVLQGWSMWFIGLGVPIGVVLGSIKLAIAGSNYVLLGALNKRFNMNWSKPDRLLAASVFIITLYLISPDQSELWHWAIGTSSSYMFSLSFLQLAAALILSEKVAWALIPLSFVAQSRATYAPLVFGLLFIITAWTFKRGDKNHKQWAFLSVGFLVFMTLYFIAPGNYVRLGSPSYEFDQWLYEYWKGIRNLFVTYNIAKVDTILLSLLIIAPTVLDRNANLKPKKKWVYAIPLILYGVFGITHELLFVTLTGYCEWTRVLSLHVFLFYCMVIIYGFWFLPKLVIKLEKFNVIICALASVALIVSLYEDFSQKVQKAEIFANQYDDRLTEILDFKGTEGDTLIVEPIIYSGILYFADLPAEADHWHNHDFKHAHNLKFEVITSSTHNLP